MKKAFTLLELIITVAIISLLALLTMLSLGMAREKARRVVCISNLRQIGIAFKMYCQEYDGLFPPFMYYFQPGAPQRGAPPIWVILIRPRRAGVRMDLGPDIFTCPSDKDPIMVTYYDERTGVSLGRMGISYAYNIVLHLDGVRLQNIRNPSDLVLLFDGNATRMQGRWHGDPDWYERVIVRRHNNVANAVFVDSHAAWTRTFTPSMFIPQ
jgi:prepilin-type N-terminal cleavage/methylation domain-containing protein/prepilin-type processing-associated H-X9-DG protein